MNIETTVNKTISTGEAQQNQANPNQKASINENKQSFKDALKYVALTDAPLSEVATTEQPQVTNFQKNEAGTPSENLKTKEKLTEQGQIKITENKDEISMNQNMPLGDTGKSQTINQPSNQVQTNIENKAIDVKKEELSNKKDLKDQTISEINKHGMTLQPILELNSKIETINDLKTKGLSKTTKMSKSEIETNTKEMKTLKMDSSDALFFASLVKNNDFSIQSQLQSGNNSNAAELTNETAMAPAQVSAALIDALSDSMKTNKPFRIDFDKNIAVIMKVNKEGKLSAEFIPGDKAVEAYLKNNIPLLKESFDSQNISYADLSYKRQHRDQQENNNKNNKKNKENENE